MSRLKSTYNLKPDQNAFVYPNDHFHMLPVSAAEGLSDDPTGRGVTPRTEPNGRASALALGSDIQRTCRRKHIVADSTLSADSEHSV